MSALLVFQNATASEIRRSFRQLSLIHHPDKTDAEDAEIKFRRVSLLLMVRLEVIDSEVTCQLL